MSIIDLNHARTVAAARAAGLDDPEALVAHMTEFIDAEANAMTDRPDNVIHLADDPRYEAPAPQPVVYSGRTVLVLGIAALLLLAVGFIAGLAAGLALSLGHHLFGAP